MARRGWRHRASNCNDCAADIAKGRHARVASHSPNHYCHGHSGTALPTSCLTAMYIGVCVCVRRANETGGGSE
jgi:hypothetical protein